MPNNQTILQWDGDVLNRKGIALFLEKLVLKKIESGRVSPNANALCFALDGDWGTGKTFFVKNWIKDLRNNQYPVIHFDAWINDLTDDPLVGFMAYLKSELEPLIKELPLAERLEAGKKLSELMQQAGKAVMPALGIITKSIAKKLLGDEIVDLAGLSAKINEQNNEDTNGFIIEGVDKFFEESLQNHTEKMKAIELLKESIVHLLEYLNEKTQYQSPLFIFIDELDRCRPDYAIRLLEGVKHLFDAKNVCFVVSTNMTQLSESVRAIYGAGFDAYRYLKRFFAFEYMLPEPDYDAFALMLVKDSFLATSNLKAFSGLPKQDNQDQINLIAVNFAIIAKAFNMDLRSQQQCFRSSEAAIAATSDSEPFYCFYMFFLAALFHYNKTHYEKLVSSVETVLEQEKFHFINADVVYSYLAKNRNNGFSYTREEGKIKVSEIFEKYREMAATNLLKISRMDIENEYPHSIKASIRGNLPSITYAADENNYPYLNKYPQLLRMAGQIK